jgi:hypothetical protein
VARIVRERTDGKTAYAIARNLNKDAVPTALIPQPRGMGSRRVRVTLVHAHGSRVAHQITALTAGLIDRRPHPASRRDLVVELTLRGQEIVHAVTAHRREEIARVVHNMPQRERYGLVSTLTAFTTAGGEPPARLEIQGW